jgi:hypothetical protein
LNGTHPINRPLKNQEVIETELFICYPDFNKPVLFDLYPDSSDHQWGQPSCRIKSQTTIAFYSRKINTAQKQLLSAIETCKAERSTRISC